MGEYLTLEDDSENKNSCEGSLFGIDCNLGRMTNSKQSSEKVFLFMQRMQLM